MISHLLVSQKLFEISRFEELKSPNVLLDVDHLPRKYVKEQEWYHTVSSKSHNCDVCLCESSAANPALRVPNTSLTIIAQHLSTSASRALLYHWRWMLANHTPENPTLGVRANGNAAMN